MPKQEDYDKLLKLQEEIRAISGEVQDESDDASRDQTRRLMEKIDEHETLRLSLRQQEAAEQAEYQRLRKHRAYVALGDDHLRDLLKLPEDVYLAGVSRDERTQSFHVHLYSDRFQEVEDGAESVAIQADIRLGECEHGLRHFFFDFPEGITDAPTD